MNKCTKCGKPSIKAEDFLVQEYNIINYDKKSKVENLGIIRVSLCEDCIREKYDESIKNLEEDLKSEDKLWRSLLVAAICFIGAAIVASNVENSQMATGLFVFIGIAAIVSGITKPISLKNKIKTQQSKFQEAVISRFKDISLLDIFVGVNLANGNEQVVLNISKVNNDWEVFTEYEAMSATDILQKNNIVCAPLEDKEKERHREYFVLPHDADDLSSFIAELYCDEKGIKIKNAAGIAKIYSKIATEI